MRKTIYQAPQTDVQVLDIDGLCAGYSITDDKNATIQWSRQGDSFDEEEVDWEDEQK